VSCARCGAPTLKRPDHLKKQSHAYCSVACRIEARKVADAKWRDKSAIKAYMAAYVASRRDYFNAVSREWSKANRNKKIAATQRYRARLKGATIEPVDFDRIVQRDGMVCHICGLAVVLRELGFDHVVPLARGGKHSEVNIAVCHRRCNSRKGDRITITEVR
jgi:hypothetical protein